MKTSQIGHPVYTLDNRLLLAADTRLTQDVLDAMIETNKDSPYQAHSFTEFGNVFQDLLQLMGQHFDRGSVDLPQPAFQRHALFDLAHPPKESDHNIAQEFLPKGPDKSSMNKRDRQKIHDCQ